MKFKLKNEPLSIVLGDEQLATMVGFVAKAGKRETGGILIGHYSEDNSTAIITEVTGAPNDSSSGPCWFSRGVKGLKKMLKAYWESKQYYLGEWHLHPNASPYPSGQDRRQLKEIANSERYNCPEPIMIIIGGNATKFSLGVYITRRNANDISQMYEDNEDTLSPSIMNPDML